MIRSDDPLQNIRNIIEEWSKGCSNGEKGSCLECSVGALRAIKATLDRAEPNEGEPPSTEVWTLQFPSPDFYARVGGIIIDGPFYGGTTDNPTASYTYLWESPKSGRHVEKVVNQVLRDPAPPIDRNINNAR